MHPWFLCRNYMVFWMWLNAPDYECSDTRRRWQYFLSIALFIILPMVLIGLYEHTGWWNPFMGLDEDDDPVRLVTQSIPYAYWIGLWAMCKIAVTKRFMPNELKQVHEAFDDAELKYKAKYRFSWQIRYMFEKDVLKRAPIYIKACKKTSPEEVALSSIADITVRLGEDYLHEAITKRLDEIDKNRPRLDRILALR